MGSCYCKRKINRKVGSLQKLSEFYTTETSVIYCWGGELILSPMWTWLTPQLCKHWCFDCRFYGYRRWSLCLVCGMLWLEQFTTVRCHGLVGSPHFVCFVYGSCPMWHLYFVKPSFCYLIRVMLCKSSTVWLSCWNQICIYKCISAINMCTAAHWFYVIHCIDVTLIIRYILLDVYYMLAEPQWWLIYVCLKKNKKKGRHKSREREREREIERD